MLELLDDYGVESYERERERVQLAILKLSEGNEEKLREFVAVAKRDYRDVLFWAEYPEESRFGYAGEAAKSKKNVREVRHQASGRFVIRETEIGARCCHNSVPRRMNSATLK